MSGTDVVALRRKIATLTEEVRVLGRLAGTDPLTGLANRRGWDEQLGRGLATSRVRCPASGLLRTRAREVIARVSATTPSGQSCASA